MPLDMPDTDTCSYIVTGLGEAGLTVSFGLAKRVLTKLPF
jgi:hypothetical protein